MGTAFRRVVETVVPTRLGTNFRWLLSSTVVNNLGDGIALAAGPLLVASLTRDPFLVSMALLSQWLPMLLFGIVGGVAADRFHRRRMVVVVDLARAAVLAVLVATIVTDSVNITVVLVALFVLGTAETFADSASSTLLPSVVARRDLGLANARMQGAFLLTNQLVAPPIGAFLFATGMALPFARAVRLRRPRQRATRTFCLSSRISCAPPTMIFSPGRRPCRISILSPFRSPVFTLRF